jgi:hypothetical protein
MTRQMIDSAFPLGKTPPCDIILIYAGGDTPHPWTTAEILAMPSRYRWPCWVRSNPSQVNAGVDAALFAAWLHGHHVPQHTCVILDLETAVHAAYVNVFNLALRAAGYKVTKYGSQSTIWANPQTDGGTFVALPGHPNALSTEGDTVATQYAFEGGFDRSIVKDQADLPLWDTRPPTLPLPHRRKVISHVTGGHHSLADLCDDWGDAPATVLRLSLERSPHGRFTPEMYAYVNEVFARDRATAAPAGISLDHHQPQP